MKRLKVLMSAYACEPGKGSEPGVGWNVAREMANYHDIWVITRANNRPVIEAELANYPVDGLHFVYYDLPRWARWWKKGGRGIQLYYYLWQLGIYPLAKRLHRDVGFDLAHHVTFGRYWSPSLISFLPVPFLWGPLGGGESAPSAFWRDFTMTDKIYELQRDLARWLGEIDPLVIHTAKKSKLVIASTNETAERLLRMGVNKLHVFLQMGFNQAELAQKEEITHTQDMTLRFITISRLLHWKGVHLGIRAFAVAGLSAADYWIVGDGPERDHLGELAKQLGVFEQVCFWNLLPRAKVLRCLQQSQVMLHPSLHDQAPAVIFEALALGNPVICLDLGGPAVQVTEETGFKIPAHDPQQVVNDIAEAMKKLAASKTLRMQMGTAGQQRVKDVFSWHAKANEFNRIYDQIAK